MQHTTDFIHGEINFPDVGDQLKSFRGLMLFRKNDSDDLFSKLKDDNNDNGDSNPSRSRRALRIQKRKSTLSFFLSQNPCGSSPCQKNSTCQAGFTSKGYRCVFPQGLGGENCDQGILSLFIK